MELVWQTNGFQECQPDLYGQMGVVAGLHSCPGSLVVLRDLRPRAGAHPPTPTDGPPLPPSLSASPDGREGVFLILICACSLPSPCGVINERLLKSLYKKL